MTTVGAMLAALVAGDVTVLHGDVVLLRGDGARFDGRAAVCAMFAAHEADAGVSYTVLRVEPARVVVALTLRDTPGALRFALEGDAVDGLLAVVRVVVS
jgi:hypothetical protein